MSDGMEEVNKSFEDMTIEQLIVEQAQLEADVLEIDAQLIDLTRQNDMRADYLSWRAKAQFAKAAKKGEIRVIKALITVKQAERAAENKRKRTPQPTDEDLAAVQARKDRNRADYEARQQQSAERKALTLDAIQGNGGAEGLLLRTWVAVQHMRSTTGTFPGTFTPWDGETLSAVHTFLIARFGSKNVIRAVLGEPFDVSEAAS